MNKSRKKRRAAPETMFDFSVLRELRRQKGMNIGEVSEISGVSPAVISKLERNQSSAELETLFRIGRAFEMHPSELLGMAESRSAHKISSSSHRSGGLSFREINYGNVRCIYGGGPKGSMTAKPELHKDDYELCWILQGRVECALPFETHQLSAGEAIQFDALLEHSYKVLEDCTMLIVHLKKGKRF